MEHRLLQYVATMIPPERAALNQQCHALLLDFYPDGWPTVLDQILDQVESRTSTDMIDMVHEAIIENLQEMVRECNLDFSHRFDFHHNLPSLYQLAQGLYSFENHTDMVSLDSRFHATEDPLARVAGVLCEVMPGLDDYTFYEMVNHVSPTCIARMAEIIEERLKLAAPIIESSDKVEVVQGVLAKYGALYPELLTLPYASIGGSFDSYINLYSETLLTMPEPAAAHAFIVAAVLSGLTREEASKAIPLSIQRVYAHDLRRAMKVVRIANGIEYNQET